MAKKRDALAAAVDVARAAKATVDDLEAAGVVLPVLSPIVAGEPPKTVPIFGTFRCCGVDRLSLHRENVAAGTCSREAFLAAQKGAK